MDNITAISYTNFFNQSTDDILSQLSEKLATNISYKFENQNDLEFLKSELKERYYTNSNITLTDIVLDYTVPDVSEALIRCHGVQKMEITLRLTSIKITLLIYPSGIIIIEINKGNNSYDQLCYELINNVSIINSKPKTVLKIFSQIKNILSEVFKCIEIKHVLLIQENGYSQIFSNQLNYKLFQPQYEFSKIIALCRKNGCLIFNLKEYLDFNSKNHSNFHFANLQDMKLCIVDDMENRC